MPAAHDARRANVSLTYDGVNISEDLAPYLISFTYTDNADNKADDLSITLEDREGKWRDPWFPSKGATLTPSIITRDWNNAGAVQCAACAAQIRNAELKTASCLQSKAVGHCVSNLAFRVGLKKTKPAALIPNRFLKSSGAAVDRSLKNSLTL